MNNNTNNANNTNSSQNNRNMRSRRNPNIASPNTMPPQRHQDQQHGGRLTQQPSLTVRRTPAQRRKAPTDARQGWQDNLRPVSREPQERPAPIRRNVRPSVRPSTSDANKRKRGLPARGISDDDSQTRISAAIPKVAKDGSDRKGAPSSDRRNSQKKKRGPKHEGTMMSGLLKGIIYIVIVLVISGFSSYFIIAVGNDVFAFVKATDIYQIEIPENADIDTVADILKENNIIRYPSIFKLYSKYKKFSGNFVAGLYEVNPSMNYDELLRAFRPRSVRQTIWITIPEGYTVDEIINLFISKGIGTKEGFIEAINNYDYDYKFLEPLKQTISPDRPYRLEGYLFPDTYQFYTDSSEVDIVKRLLNNFDRKFNETFYTRAEELGLTIDEVVILASMIQEETKYLSEFEIVSSVFHNRLRNKRDYPYLQSDATILYGIQIATGERPNSLNETTFQTPYNTYLHKGFCPGPIANPGYDAIYCALYPASTDYYYFVSDKDGVNIFSRTLAEHNAAIARIKQGG